MKIRLELVAETPKARRYKRADGTLMWIPRSVVKSTLKFKHSNDDPLGSIPKPEIHELEIEDWWWDKTRYPLDDNDE